MADAPKDGAPAPAEKEGKTDSLATEEVGEKHKGSPVADDAPKESSKEAEEAPNDDAPNDDAPKEDAATEPTKAVVADAPKDGSPAPTAKEGLSKYEQLALSKRQRNQERLAMLGLGPIPGTTNNTKKKPRSRSSSSRASFEVLPQRKSRRIMDMKATPKYLDEQEEVDDESAGTNLSWDNESAVDDEYSSHESTGKKVSKSHKSQNKEDKYDMRDKVLEIEKEVEDRGWKGWRDENQKKEEEQATKFPNVLKDVKIDGKSITTFGRDYVDAMEVCDVDKLSTLQVAGLLVVVGLSYSGNLEDKRDNLKKYITTRQGMFQITCVISLQTCLH